MAGLTTHGATAVLAGTALPATLWMQLHVADPGTAGTENGAIEETRQAISLEPGATPATAVSDDAVEWSDLAADESAGWFTLWDDDVEGDPWFVGTISPALALVFGGAAVLPAGSVRVTAGRHGVMT